VGPGRAGYSLLYVDRRCSSWTHARQDSGATFEFPQIPCTLICTGADIKFAQDKSAYPRPVTSHISSTDRFENRPSLRYLPCTVQHTVAQKHARKTRRNSTKSNPATLHRPSGDDTSKAHQPLQVSRNPENPLGKSRRRTAYPQQIVTTRLLYCLQDRFAQLSRLQRI
jgi:hypothetical protein